MIKVGLISDTHSYLHPGVLKFIEKCDEIWHAGDVGSMDVADKLSSIAPLVAVYGNIDNHIIRQQYKKTEVFIREGMKIMMTHIGGYPGRYARGIPDLLLIHKPGLFISGHSHILKVINDPRRKILHINPGAAGKQGLHRMITAVRFEINNSRIKDLEVFETQR